MIYDSDMNLLSEVVTQLVPRREPIKVENRLLDGSYHFQTIGTPSTVVGVQAVFTWAHKGTLDTHAAESAPIRVETTESYWVGIIRDVPSWEMIRPGAIGDRRYRGTFTLAVTSQGDMP